MNNSFLVHQVGNINCFCWEGVSLLSESFFAKTKFKAAFESTLHRIHKWKL